MRFKDAINGYESYRKSISCSCFVDHFKSMVNNIFGIELDEESYQLTTCVREFKMGDQYSRSYTFRLFIYDDISIRVIIYDPFNCVMLDASIGIDEKIDVHVEGNLGDTSFIRFKNGLEDLCEDISSLFANKKMYDIIRTSVYDAQLELQYIRSERMISAVISIHDFLKYTADDCVDNINYSKKIYRISDDIFIPQIENQLKNVWCVDKLHRIENVKKSKLFYIENLDLQDISTVTCDDLDDMVSQGYSIINIIPGDIKNKEE